MLKSSLRNSTLSLIRWIEENDYSSYDHYDYLSTKMGLVGKRLFASKKLIIGFPLLALIFFLDACFPQSRKIISKKAPSAEAIPRIASAYFNLYRITGSPLYLQRGSYLLDWLIGNLSLTDHGVGWGLHFDWQGRSFVPQQTPCVTLTAYATEAFMEGYQLTGKNFYLDIVQETSDFVAHDLNRKTDGTRTALSYTPLDQNFVINANSYAARILVDSLKFREDDEKRKLVEQIVNYLLSQQRADGAWFYFDEDDVPEKRNFIDSFHSCFVLENLFLIWKWNRDARLKNAIERGLEFFEDHFITDEFSVRYYYSYPYPTGIKVDIRGCAEAIHCFALLSEIFQHSLDLSIKIARWTIHRMQDKDGYFYFRIYPTHTNKMPYIRWGQAPMFNALTLLLSKLHSKPS
jgi:hypothetical protein